jgi:hypothetical protein
MTNIFIEIIIILFINSIYFIIFYDLSLRIIYLKDNSFAITFNDFIDQFYFIKNFYFK